MELVKKYKHRKDVEFIVIGPYMPSQNKIFKEFENLETIGKVEHSQMPNYLNKIDIFIGQGIVAKEAMSCGCLTILNQIDERLLTYHKPELENGTMLKGDIFTLVEKFINKPELIKKQSDKTVKFIRENYSLDLIVRKTIDVYEEITNSSKH